MRTPRRDIVCGRAPGAWRRACARGTARLREFAAATSWVLRWDPIDLADWNAPPFGARLAELTSAMAERRGAAAKAPPHHRAAWTQSTVDPRQPRSLESPGAPARQRRDGATAPSLERQSRRTAMRNAPKAMAAARHMPWPPQTNMTRQRLAALAGDVTRALRNLGRRPRADLDWHPAPPSSQRALTSSGDQKAIKRGLASADLHERAIGRIARALSRTPTQLPLAQRSWAVAEDPAGWARSIAQPDPGLLLIAPDAAVMVMAAPASDRRARGVSQLPAEGLRRPVRSPEPPEASRTARRTPTSAVAGNEDASDDLSKDAMTEIAPPLRPRFFSPFELAARRQSAPAQPAAQLSTASSRSPDRLRFDAVEFAEHLRNALIDDARRLGIDV
jgi:hypothetical protein